MEDYIKHYGILRKSGRYPWGSSGWGEETLTGNIKALKKKGMSENEIATSLGVSVAQLRADISAEREEIKRNQITDALKFKEKGYSNVAIAKRLGVTEGSVRNMLARPEKYENNILANTKQVLRDAVKEKKFVDVGEGTEVYLGVTNQRLNTAVRKLKDEGYEVITFQNLQLGTNKKTTIKVLCPEGTTFKEVMDNRGNIKSIPNYSNDGGNTFFGIKPPVPVDSKRVKIMYAEDGGTDRDGAIYLSNRAADLSLGGSKYAQVRINVDDKYYIKGMGIAVSPSEIPSGHDILVFSNKAKAGGIEKALKPLKDDPDNPFGAIVRQQTYTDRKTGKELQSAINIVGYSGTEGSGIEGNWDNWSRNLASQFLSKQPESTIKTQLGISYKNKTNELSEIMKLNNETIKRNLLESFADECDSSAVSLKAAKFKDQATQVLLPLKNINDKEIYAPNFKDGTEVALVRYPQGGRFEIPILRVNNSNPEGKRILGNARDAVGINSKVAEKLSGADFDGDTAVVIPNPRQNGIKNAPSLQGLVGFDNKKLYSIPTDVLLQMEKTGTGSYGSIKLMGAKGGGKTNMEMGKISNLITDMTLQNASDDELARAVRHSMVVIDAEKHKLDYKRSEIDNGIAELRNKYQKADRVSLKLGDNDEVIVERTPKRQAGGASTLISRAKSDEITFPKVKAKSIDPKTGEIKRVYNRETYIDSKTGKVKMRTEKEARMNLVKDAYALTSGGSRAAALPVERIYADYANDLKALARKARLEAVNSTEHKYSPAAAKKYKAEVDSLNEKLKKVAANAPLERQAQLLAGQVIRSRIKVNPSLKEDKEVLKKFKYQALTEARRVTGATKYKVFIEDNEWEAIRNGAITKTKFKDIIAQADTDRLRELATPKKADKVPQIMQNQISSMWNRGYTSQQIADALGVSITTVNKYK